MTNSAADTALSPNAQEVKYWNSAATRPWAAQHDSIDRLFHELTQVALDMAQPRPGERVLDVGCGSGTTVLELAYRVAPAGQVLGIDVSEQSITLAKKRIAESDLRNADVTIADASTEALAPQSFDLMFSRFGVMFFAGPAATFVNLRKAMKPHGRLALAVWRTPAENGWLTAAHKAVGHLLTPAPAPDPEAPGPFSWADPARVRRILEGAGFRELSLAPRDFAMRLAPAGGAAAAADFAVSVGPVARSLIDAPDALRQTVRSVLEAFFRSIDGSEGIVLPGAIWIVRARV